MARLVRGRAAFVPQSRRAAELGLQHRHGVPAAGLCTGAERPHRELRTVLHEEPLCDAERAEVHRLEPGEREGADGKGRGIHRVSLKLSIHFLMSLTALG